MYFGEIENKTIQNIFANLIESDQSDTYLMSNWWKEVQSLNEDPERLFYNDTDYGFF